MVFLKLKESTSKEMCWLIPGPKDNKTLPTPVFHLPLILQFYLPFVPIFILFNILAGI